MKVSVFYCVVMLFSLQLFAVNRSHGQNINTTNIAFGVKHASLKASIKKLREESGYIIFYPSEKINDDKKAIDMANQTRTIAETLTIILSDTGLGYKQQGNKTIVIFELPKADKEANDLVMLSGTVVDSKGLPLPGVTIRLKNNSQSIAFTDNKGHFNIATARVDDVLLFSFIGYKTKEIAVKSFKSPAVITLEDVVGTLDEVQITAYGSTTRRLNTGDQTTITAKEIEKYPASNALVALQGSVPGLFITQSTGTPGSTYSVNIRGLNSLNAGADPFYVIDGIPYSGGSFASQRGNSVSPNGAQAYDALSFINPQDIESINVLKDADATSIYGSRAANGVILITTKKGKAGTPRVDVNLFTGIRQLTKKLNLLNTQQYLAMRREAKRNDNAGILATDYDINGTWDTTRYTNFSDLFLGKTAHTSNAQVSVSGGNTDVQYLVSGDFRNITNLQNFTDGSDQTSSLHFNLNTGNAASRFTMTLTGGYTYNRNTMPPVDLTSYIFSIAPDAPPLFNPNGTLNFENNTFNNPLLATRQLANSAVHNLTSSMILNYKLMKGLNFQTTLGYNRQSVNEFLGVPSTAISPTSTAKPSSRFTYDTKMYWSIEPLLAYTKDISKGTLTATAGYSLQKQYSDALVLQATGYTSDLLLANIAGGTAITPLGAGYNANLYKYNAVFGRVNYNWQDKYIINLSGRYDGSSKFGEDRRFHFFPAAGVAWLFTSEDFVQKSLPFLSFGKLRASYGVTGNDQIFGYQYLANYTTLTTVNPYQGIPALAPGNLPNPNLSWETVKKSNIGLELQFFKGRIGLEGNYFLNRTSGLILGNALASTTGFASINMNQDGKVSNKGFDITLNTQNIKTQNILWSTTVLFTRQRNKLETYPNLPISQQLLLSQAVNSAPVYRYAGVDPQAGTYQFYDKNGNITTAPNFNLDLVNVININPDYFGSVTNTFTYKGFSLSFMFRYVKQIGVSVRGILASSTFPGTPNSNIPQAMLDRWQKPGDNATYQKFSTSILTLLQQFNINRFADVYYGDASYVRLQNASLGYQFPVLFAQKLHLKNFRIYANGENLATISKYGILDPENQSASRIGPLRAVVVGLQASF